MKDSDSKPKRAKSPEDYRPAQDRPAPDSERDGGAPPPDAAAGLGAFTRPRDVQKADVGDDAASSASSAH